MKNHYFFTGFPGFIATSLIKQLIRDSYEIEHIYVLVQSQFVEKAKFELNKIVHSENIALEQFSIIEGDITKPNLNISEQINSSLQEAVTHVFHLAAVYDLAVPEDIAYEVNVNGTRSMNLWVQQLKLLKRYVYFSTAYVSGTREGLILEDELTKNQTFKNHYERTKYEAELLVKQLGDELPITIIRPGIVIGHSDTGETTKFDGPYFILNFFDRLKFLPAIPYLGISYAHGNFVPVDYIFQATLYLSHADVGAGKTYHLTDPQPYNVQEVYTMLMEKYLGRKPLGIIPLSFAKALLSIPFIRKWLQVEYEALDYFTCEAQYDCTQAQNDLKDSGISCPNLNDVLDVIVQYYKEHKGDTDKQVKII